MPRMLPVRRRRWRMSPRTSSALQPTRSRPRARLRPEARARVPAGSSAAGSATSCRMRFAILSWTISGCETTSAGRYSTADGRHGLAGLSSCGPGPAIGPAIQQPGCSRSRARPKPQSGHVQPDAHAGRGRRGTTDWSVSTPVQNARWTRRLGMGHRSSRNRERVINELGRATKSCSAGVTAEVAWGKRKGVNPRPSGSAPCPIPWISTPSRPSVWSRRRSQPRSLGCGRNEARYFKNKYNHVFTVGACEQCQVDHRLGAPDPQGRT